MKYINTILLFIISTIAFGQIIPNDTLILKKAIWKTKYGEKVLYTDKAEAWIWDKLKEDLQKTHFSNNIKGAAKKAITLSKEEQKYILQEIEKNRQLVWNDNLFANSKCIELDSMWTFLKKENLIYSDKHNYALISKDTLTLKKIENKRPWVFTFTKPIYFRDNTICLLYVRDLCGNVSGNQEACFYKNENGIWTKWIFISNGSW